VAVDGDGFRVEVSGKDVQRVLRGFSRMDRAAGVELRAANVEISEVLAGWVRAAAASSDAQSAALASTVKARRDRVPAVVAGGSSRVTSSRVPAYKLVFGAEFGARVLRQFRPHRGTDGYWFFRTVEAHRSDVVDRWADAAARITAKFTTG